MFTSIFVAFALQCGIALAFPKPNGPELHQLKRRELPDGTVLYGDYTPPQEILDAQKARWEAMYTFDPLLNRTIPQDSGAHIDAHVDLPGSGDCYVEASHSYQVCWQCNPPRGCDPCGSDEARVEFFKYDNNQRLAWLGDLPNGGWNEYQIDGLRSVFVKAEWSWLYNMYGLTSGLFHVSGHNDRNLMGDTYCWYRESHEAWGDVGAGSCQFRCQEMKW